MVYNYIDLSFWETDLLALPKANIKMMYYYEVLNI